MNEYGRKKPYHWQPVEPTYRVYYREGYAAKRVADFQGDDALLHACDLACVLRDAGISAFFERV